MIEVHENYHGNGTGDVPVEFYNSSEESCITKICPVGNLSGKEGVNEEPSVMSQSLEVADGMHEPSERSPPRKKGKKKVQKRKKSPDTDGPTKREPDIKLKKLEGF